MTQKQALSILKDGRSVFLTGPAGSGKTFLLNQFIKLLRKTNKRVAITATTGLAATHLNGQTIHSWSGIGIKDNLDARLMRQILDSPREDIISGTDVLIIDEISMLNNYRLDMVDQICQRIKGSTQPFGGIQIVLSGDFFQLPPIVDDNDLFNNAFAFNSHAWRNLNPTICYLDQQFRQHINDDLLEILNALRSDSLDQSHIDQLKTRILPNPGNLVELYCHNLDIDRINSQKLRLINAQQHIFKAYTQSLDKQSSVLKSLIKNSLASEELHLKQGALVMFIKNDPSKKFINGTQGKVKGFNTQTGYPIVVTHQNRTIDVKKMVWSIVNQDNVEIASLSQLPLKLAWAITIHKSQGMSLDGAYIDLSKTFETGMGYVALSRVKSLSNLYLKGFNQTALKINPTILAMDKIFQQQSRKYAHNLN